MGQGWPLFEIFIEPTPHCHSTKSPQHDQHNLGRLRTTHATNKQTKLNNQTENAVEVARKCANVYRLTSPLQVYTGFHAPTKLHKALHYISYCTATTDTTREQKRKPYLTCGAYIRFISYANSSTAYTSQSLSHTAEFGTSVASRLASLFSTVHKSCVISI